MPHILINGQTESGKTRLAMHICRGFCRNGFNVIVFDPIGDPDWVETGQPENEQDGRMFIHENIEKFTSHCRRSQCCGLFIDEAGEVIDNTREGKKRQWLATRSRHQGHSAHFICQRANQMSKTARDQCSRLFLFNSSLSDAKMHADEWNCPQLKRTNQLDRGEFFDVKRFGEIRLCKIDFATLRVKTIRTIKRT